MPLCSRYVRIASCDLSSMLFPMAVCLLVSGPAPLARLVVRMAPAGEAAAQGRKRNADAPEFSEGCFVPLGKAFAALARGRPRASLRSQGGTGWGVRGGCPWECGDEVAAKRCISGYDWGVWRGSGVLAGCWRLRWTAGRFRGCWSMCGGHAYEVCGVLRAIVACRCGAWWVQRSLLHREPPGGGLRRLLRHHVDCLDGRLA